MPFATHRLLAVSGALVLAVALVVLVRVTGEDATGDADRFASPRPTVTTGAPSGSLRAGIAANGQTPLTIGRGPLDLRITRSRSVAEGVVLHDIVEPGGPNQLRVLEVDPQRAASLDLAGAGRSYPSLAPVSRIGERSGAIAAVNGEFFALPGRPEFLFQSDGTLWQTALHKSNTFAISEDESRIFVERIAPKIVATDVAKDRPIAIQSWNTSPPKGGRLAGFTPIGGSVSPPPANACYARLSPTGPLAWGSGRTSVERTYRSDNASCSAKPPGFAGSEGVILAANRGSSGERTLRALDPGTRVRMSVTFGIRGVLDVAGGQPVLVKNGKSDLPPRCKTSFCLAQPRTGVGYTSDGRVLIATVHGRQAGWSVGMSLKDWTDSFLQLGAQGALNLDGGGSTTMWVKGMGVVNRPSNAGHRERPVGTALLVLPGADPDTPKSLR